MRIGVLRRDDGTVVCARCEVARSPVARMRGLLGRDGLEPGEGMLFPGTGSIHMFFMRFPIDAVFCDRELRVLEIVSGLKPWRTASVRHARTVVELPSGGAAGLEPGDRLVLDAP